MRLGAPADFEDDIMVFFHIEAHNMSLSFEWITKRLGIMLVVSQLVNPANTSLLLADRPTPLGIR